MTDPIQSPFDTHDLDERVGREAHMGDLGRALVRVVAATRPAHVSSLHVTCSDGLEQECRRHFHDTVARDITPAQDRDWAPLRTANLGGRYEWGSGAVSFSHFDGPGDHIQVVQINGHVGVIRDSSGPRFGFYERGPRNSVTCGALALLLAEQAGPFLDELRETFTSEGIDRIIMLNDGVPKTHKKLFAAVVQARLQARRALLDLARQTAPGEAGPDRILIVAAVTFNQRGVDHELLVGHYAGERDADGVMHAVYTGLGDNPMRYRYEHTLAGVHLTQDGPFKRTARGPRAHRELPVSDLEREIAEEKVELSLAPPPAQNPFEDVPVELTDNARRTLDQIDGWLNDPEHPWSSLAVKGACIALTEALAVPAVVTLFAGGALAANHAFRMRRIASGGAHEHEVEELAHEATRDLANRNPAEAKSILAGATARLRSLYGH